MALPTLTYQNNLKIAQIANALYGSVVGTTTNNAVLADIASVGYDATVNSYYTFSFGNMSAATVAANMAANLGITAASVGAANVTVATNYIVAALNAAPGAEGVAVTNVLSLWSGLTADPIFGAAATAWNATIADAQAYTASGATADVAIANATVGAVFPLTTGVDAMTGTAGADTFNAYIYDNENSLQSGDTIDGGAGNDTLFADIGNSQNFAITAHTSNIETVQIRVQAGQWDSADNNIAGVGIIDAERMDGVTTYENNNSRADLVIEDVRIQDNEITSDITIVMRDTDPGAVDYAVYFDQNSLRNVSETTSVMNLRVLDTYATAQGLDSLQDSPYGSFTFWASVEGGAYESYTLASAAMQDAQTLAEMVTAMQDAADATLGAGAVTVSLGSSYTVPDSVTGDNVTGNEIVLTAETNVEFDTTMVGSGWLATETVPAISGLYTSFNQNSASTTDLVTSTIVLDNVGRGSNGGDLIVGGLSVGDTSSSKGVQQFDITVEDNSKLSNILSTNNTLRVVNIVNGTTDEMTDAYTTTVANAGNLAVGVSNDQDSDLVSGPQSIEDSAYGFTDVQTIDASTMTGKLSFTAEITDASIAKYQDTTDSANSPTADNVAFAYTGGTNDDSMSVLIDGAFASATDSQTGQADFTFALNGGNGNDALTLNIGGKETANWYVDQKQNANVSISGGAGNDTIWTPGAGAVIISAGAGDDTVYTDNIGDNATWVVNDAQAILADLGSDGAVTGFMYNGQLTVSFSGANAGGGVTSGVADAAAANFTNGYEVVVDIPTGTNYAVTQLHINQAIKAAINDDAVLSKLLVAEDGPANTLVITSLIDGAFVADDLMMSVTSTDVTTLTASEQATVLTAYKSYAANSTAVIATAQVANAAAVTAFNGVAGMDVNQVLGLTSGSGITVTTAVTTQGVTAVAEVQTIDFTGVTAGANGNFTVGGVTVAVLAADTTQQISDKVVAALNLVAAGTAIGDATASNAGGTTPVVTITYTAAYGVEANALVVDGTATLSAVPATVEATAGVDAVAEVFTATVSGGADTGEIISFQGDASAALNASDNTSTIAAAIAAGDTAAAGYDVTSVVGNVITYTYITDGVQVDADTTDFTSSIANVTADGSISTAESDNTIDLGTGNDVLVLGTGVFSNDTVKFTGYALGENTIVNFQDGAGTNVDKLNFTSYLVDKSSASGSTESQVRIATSLNADANVEANSVTVINAAAANFDATETFAGLTAANFLAAIQSSNTGSADYAGLSAGDLDAVNTYVASGAPTTLVGGVGHAVVMIENTANEGEYAVFELTFNGLATNATADFTAATLIGVVDFGNTVDGLVLGNLS